MSALLTVAMLFTRCVPACATESPISPQMLKQTVQYKSDTGFLSEISQTGKLADGIRYPLDSAGSTFEITERWLGNDLEQTIVEGDKSNVLLYSDDGELYLDGYQTTIAILRSENGSQDIIQLRMGAWVYRDTPYYNGGSYSVYLESYIWKVGLGKAVGALSLATFISIIGTKVAALALPSAFAGIALGGMMFYYEQMKQDASKPNQWNITAGHQPPTTMIIAMDN